MHDEYVRPPVPHLARVGADLVSKEVLHVHALVLRHHLVPGHQVLQGGPNNVMWRMEQFRTDRQALITRHAEGVGDAATLSCEIYKVKPVIAYRASIEVLLHMRMRGRTLAIMNRWSRASYRGSTVEMIVAMKPASSAARLSLMLVTSLQGDRHQSRTAGCSSIRLSLHTVVPGVHRSLSARSKQSTRTGWPAGASQGLLAKSGQAGTHPRPC